jgi:hypothetical protein
VAQPNSALIFDADGQLRTIVHPDFERQLNDPAFNPKDHVHVRISRAAYDACASDIALLKAAKPLVQKENLTAAAKLQIKIDALEAAANPVPDVELLP